jgi:cell filamentation protein
LTRCLVLLKTNDVLNRYPGGALLKDKDRLINRYSTQRSIELETIGNSGEFNLERLKTTHKYLFQDAPDLGFDDYKPGEFRKEVVSGDWLKNRSLNDGSVHTVAYSRMDSDAIKKLDEILKQANPLKLSGLSAEDFSKKISEIYTICDYIHPFKDGNSRTLRTFTQELAKESGYFLKWEELEAGENSRDELYRSRDKGVNEISLKDLRSEFTQKKVALSINALKNAETLEVKIKKIVSPIKNHL